MLWMPSSVVMKINIKNNEIRPGSKISLGNSVLILLLKSMIVMPDSFHV